MNNNLPSDFEFNPSQEIIDFATQFSENYIQCAPGEYFSKEGACVINYHTHKKVGLTDVTISLTTGIIYLYKSRFEHPAFTPDFIFYLILWCMALKEQDRRELKQFQEINYNKYALADKIAIEYYLETGRSKKNIIIGYDELFKSAPNELNKERILLINKMLKDEPVKFTWEKNDTFKTIHEKLKALKGQYVVNKVNLDEPLKIFNVGEIKEMEISGFGEGFTKFLEGDSKYQSGDGAYNFKGMKSILMWGFTVEFGFENDERFKSSQEYNFMILKNGTYEESLLVNSLVVDSNHPFIFYS